MFPDFFGCAKVRIFFYSATFFSKFQPSCHDTQPYTTVFFQLDCGYWPADKAAILAERLSAAE